MPFKHAFIILSVVCVSMVNASTLTISDVPLELSSALPANILILTDDSGSMDWEILTQNNKSSGAFIAPNIDGSGLFTDITQRLDDGDGAADGDASLVPAVSCDTYANPAIPGTGEFVNGYLYIVAFPSNQFKPSDSSLADENIIANCYVADDDSFRARNSKFNPLYFDPNKTYIPWAGVDSNGVAYGNADITDAPDNPYQPQHHINLTLHKAGLAKDGISRVSGDGFKYYDWNDDGDGIFEAGEEVESLIKTAFDASTKTYPLSEDEPNDVVQNFANWFTYYRKREFVAKAIASHAVAGNSSSRIGFATTNQNAGVGQEVVLQNLSLATGNKRTVLDAIFSANSNGLSPLRTASEKVGKYFGCQAGDIFNSTTDSSPGNAGCPVLPTPGGECQANTTFIFTDGFDNGTADLAVNDADSDNASVNSLGEFDGGAFADSTSPQDMDTLADVAMFYYENDLHGLTDNVAITSFDFNRDPNSLLTAGGSLHQHLKTNVIGIFNNNDINAVIDTSFPSNPNSTFTWDNSASFAGNMDDLRHAAYNGRGSFIPVLDSNDIPTVMNTVENAFSRTSSNSGSTTAMAFNTQSITQNTLVFRTFSNLATNSGELVAQQVNPDGSFDVDGNGDPVFVWSAANALGSQSPSSRLILTYEPNTNLGKNFLFSQLTNNQITDLATPLPNPASPLTITEAAIAATRINYLRGDSSDEGTDFDSGEMRTRAALSTTNGITTGGKLGDIVHSSPVFVGTPPFANRFGGAFPSSLGNTYFEFRTQTSPVNIRDREELVYVGANDGMLHAFIADPNSTDKGKEKFAYIPDVLLNEIGEFTDPNYSHRFYVDSTPSVNDAFITTRANTTTPEWRTVLVNGLGAGGKGYFALDITDPDNINTNSVMWEFTDSDDADLGFTFSRPVIGMSNIDSGEQEWVAIFGNGYNSASGDAAIYIVFLDEAYTSDWVEGSNFVKIDLASGGTPNGIGGVTGIDTDGNGTVDRLYAGDLQGNVYVVDISGSTTTSWNLAYTLFNASYQTGVLPEVVQPITTKPTVVNAPGITDGYIVIVGTGSYFTTDDALNTDIQSIYGLLDDPSQTTISKYSSPSDLVEQEFTTSIDNNSGLVVRTVSTNPVNYTGVNAKRGWFIDFDIAPPGLSSGVQFPGERPVRNLQLRNGQLFFSTVIPQDGTTCATPAGGFGLSVSPITGSVGSEVIFDINIDGVFDESDKILISNVNTVIAGTRFESTPGDTTFIGDYRVTQLSNTNVDRILVNPDLNSGGSIGALLGRHSWKEMR